jgi:predicted nucleic acid-binding protein
LFAGVVSSSGAARALLVLGSESILRVIVSQQVLAETERNLARKVPSALPMYRQAIKESRVRIVVDPPIGLVNASRHLISHRADVPILLAAMQSSADFLVTLNRKHLIDDPAVSLAAGILIGSPGDALHWVRTRLVGET